MMPAIFLDRDGVIIANRPQYVRSWADVEIFPQAIETLKNLNGLPYKIVLVTNQAGVGRGIISLEIAEEINRRLRDEIEGAGGRIDGIYMCPHKPEDACDCRKPRPGLIQRAARELSLDLAGSMLIGDMYSDLLAGQAAGVPRLALVRTGLGANQLDEAPVDQLGQFEVFDNLSEALGALIMGFQGKTEDQP